MAFFLEFIYPYRTFDLFNNLNILAEKALIRFHNKLLTLPYALFRPNKREIWILINRIIDFDDHSPFNLFDKKCLNPVETCETTGEEKSVEKSHSASDRDYSRSR